MGFITNALIPVILNGCIAVIIQEGVLIVDPVHQKCIWNIGILGLQRSSTVDQDNIFKVGYK